MYAIASAMAEAAEPGVGSHQNEDETVDTHSETALKVNESEELPARTALTATDAAEGRPVSVPPAMRPDARAAISLTREACVPEEGSL